MKAVVLLSGGLDSATAAGVARSRGFAIHALSINYGQRHKIELDHATAVGRALGVQEHRIVHIDLRTIGGSALTDTIAVPKDRTGSEIETGIPVTYVPARNTIFLAVALGFAEAIGAFDIFIGANVYDYSGYPDCRPEFLRAFETVANLATKAAIENKGQFRIHAPLIQMTKAEIIRTGLGLGVPLSATLSCYDPDARGRPCGRCDSCQLRQKGFTEAGVPDLARSEG